MRIGLLLPNAPGYSETFFRSKIRGLQVSGYEVILFAGKQNEDFKLCTLIPFPPVYSAKWSQIGVMLLHLVVLTLKTPRKAYNYYKLERQTGKSKRTALENLYLNSRILPYHLDWLHFGFATMASRRENLAKAIGAKLAVSLRGYDIAIYPLKHPGCYDQLWQQVDKVHTISDDLLALAYKNGLPKSVAVQKITPAIDAGHFQRSTPIPEEFNNPLRLLTVARLHWKKGLEHTLEALALLREFGIDFQYTIIGTGEEYERLAFAAHQLGIGEQVVFKGKLSHEAIKEAMERADIYIQYSISEGFCNAVLEAQAMGLLCIVSDAEGLQENVIHGQTGWVTPARKPKLLSQKLLSVIHLPQKDLRVIRQKAIERIRRDFNHDKQHKEFKQFYQS